MSQLNGRCDHCVSDLATDGKCGGYWNDGGTLVPCVNSRYRVVLWRTVAAGRPTRDEFTHGR